MGTSLLSAYQKPASNIALNGLFLPTHIVKVKNAKPSENPAFPKVAHKE
jgi:hypothetical protein